jgi:hypothetical protein
LHLCMCRLARRLRLSNSPHQFVESFATPRQTRAQANPVSAAPNGYGDGGDGIVITLLTGCSAQNAGSPCRDQKRAVRVSESAGQHRSERTVTGHHRHIIDVGLRIAAHAKALRILTSEIEARRADLHLCCGLWQGRNPVCERLRNVRSDLKARPDLARRKGRNAIVRSSETTGRIGQSNFF